MPVLIEVDKRDIRVGLISGLVFEFKALYKDQQRYEPTMRAIEISDGDNRTIRFPLENVAFVETTVHQPEVRNEQ